MNSPNILEILPPILISIPLLVILTQPVRINLMSPAKWITLSVAALIGLIVWHFQIVREMETKQLDSERVFWREEFTKIRSTSVENVLHLQKRLEETESDNERLRKLVSSADRNTDLIRQILRELLAEIKHLEFGEDPEKRLRDFLREP